MEHTQTARHAARGQMTAMVREEYGDATGLCLDTVDVPVPGPDQILVAVQHASLNPADRYKMMGWPYLVRPSLGLRRPSQPTFGTDAAGVVQAVGRGVTRLSVGDRVLGASEGAFAQYALVTEARAARIPDGVSTAQAAALPIAGATAIQGLRRAGIDPSAGAGSEQPSVLVNGASGGVGHLAVQLAVAAGARVTAVCSARNADLARTWGAVEVIDYATTDFTDLGRSWDVVFDNHGNHPVRATRRAVAPGGTWVLVNGPMSSSWVGPIRYLLAATLGTIGRAVQLAQFTASETAEDLALLLQLVADGRLTPHVEATFSLEELPAAMRHLATNRTRGKLLIDIGHG